MYPFRHACGWSCSSVDGCARLWCVHEAPPRGPGSGRGPPRRGISVSELKKSHRRRYFRSPDPHTFDMCKRKPTRVRTFLS
jgi:hypothetical protein